MSAYIRVPAEVITKLADTIARIQPRDDLEVLIAPGRAELREGMNVSFGAATWEDR